MTVNAATLATQSKIKVDYYYEILYARIDVTAQRKHRDSQRISFITEFLNVYYGLILVELKKLYMISNGFTSSLHELPNVNESLMDVSATVFVFFLLLLITYMFIYFLWYKRFLALRSKLHLFTIISFLYLVSYYWSVKWFLLNFCFNCHESASFLLLFY